ALACQAIVATPAGSIAFPETGIGIFPGLGGMLRFAKYTSPALAKYYTFTGAPIKAADAQTLGIITRLVQPAEIEPAIAELVSQGKTDKYPARDIPAAYAGYATLCAAGNVDKLLAGQAPDGTDEALAAKTAKVVGFKAPLALKMANEIIDAQAAQSIAEGVETELGRLSEIFATDDALEGLSSAGRKRPEFKGS
ncbi:MAG: 3-hydroxyacyl-CoA dehydrogenase/enoyl-CoA hydratase family protein, partial [Desulfobacterales bacterium]|nr:3-hydroxyacyl-CoA dehydrogenase/enoyl-CoA hydratase family protein [Desulfobacterales bacterium]